MSLAYLWCMDMIPSSWQLLKQYQQDIEQLKGEIDQSKQLLEDLNDEMPRKRQRGERGGAECIGSQAISKDDLNQVALRGQRFLVMSHCWIGGGMFLETIVGFDELPESTDAEKEEKQLLKEYRESLPSHLRNRAHESPIINKVRCNFLI